MNKRVLLAWEVGGGQGHFVRLELFGAALRARGYETVYALRRIPSGRFASLEVHQAPDWPGATDRSYRLPNEAATHGDVLAELGIGREPVLEAMLRSWDGLLAEIKPDAIVADAAPACLMAARGRIPTIAVGNGFTLPAASAERFSSLKVDGQPAQVDEAEILSTIASALKKTGRPPLRHLPEIYAADRESVGTFAELDPYADRRETPPAAPSLPAWDHRTAAEREEVFAYFSFDTRASRTAIEALALAAAGGLRVRLHAPGLDDETAGWLTAHRVRVEPVPVPLADIHARARLLISNGNLGFVSFGLAAGIPHIVLPWSLATGWTGRAVERLGVGRSLNIEGGNPLEPALLRQVIRESFYASNLTERAKELAPDFLRRTEPPASETTAALVGELL